MVSLSNSPAPASPTRLRQRLMLEGSMGASWQKNSIPERYCQLGFSTHPRRTASLRQYEYLLQQVGVANPGAKIESFNLVTREARTAARIRRAKLSDKWEGSVPEKFSAHARRSPHNIAVV